MHVEIQFSKLTGAGNDFVLIDNMTRWLNVEHGPLARTVCNRHFGIGADGLLVLEPAKRADFTMLYYNADGSFGGMCGNGGRCAALFAHRAGYCGTEFSFRALGYTYRGKVHKNHVALLMKPVKRVVGPHRVTLPGQLDLEYYSVDTGAPHIVSFVQNISRVAVGETGRMLREHTNFSPRGTNVNFAQQLGNGRIAMRTYERGVEAETLACGTGAVATALAANCAFDLLTPVEVLTRSRRVLTVGFEKRGKEYKQIVLSGEAAILFAGKALYHFASHKLYI